MQPHASRRSAHQFCLFGVKVSGNLTTFFQAVWNEGGFGGTGFSLWGLVLARTQAEACATKIPSQKLLAREVEKNQRRSLNSNSA
jgi:hypothetical protein